MASVQLYVYDLSNGMAKSLSMQLTGKQLDGIWHTSVVVFGKEVFYGQGISVTRPGASHHGSPLQIIDMGETAIDQETFNDYIQDMSSHYTAAKYHLLDFNCNSFTNDVVGFLTGRSIPGFISNLPSDFLSTPLGQALRPTIDSMYQGGRPSTNGGAHSSVASSLIQSVASQAQSPASGSIQHPSDSISSPLHPCTNPSSFQSLLTTHRGVVAYFTSQGCPPCRMIEPIFERIAQAKGIPPTHGPSSSKSGPAFTKIDLGVGLSRDIAAQYSISATPTFLFFLNGEKVGEVRGANEPELRSQVDLLIFQAYPPHPHTTLSLPAVKAMSLKPILFTQIPQFDAMLNKLTGFISDQPAELKTAVGQMFTFLKARFPSKPSPTTIPLPVDQIPSWIKCTTSLVNILPPESLFPLVDMWRLCVLDSEMAAWLSMQPMSSPTPFKLFLFKFNQQKDSPNRPFSLTLLRLLCNAFSDRSLCQSMLSSGTGAPRASLTKALVSSLLSNDTSIRTAASSLIFNCTAAVQQARTDDVCERAGYYVNPNSIKVHADEPADEDWHVELTSALVEALNREENDEVVHRLVASLACIIRLSPFMDSTLHSLLEVLQIKLALETTLTSRKEQVQSLVRDLLKLVTVSA